MRRIKIAIGMITKSIATENVLFDFLSNAERYGHDIDSVIVTYSGKCDERLRKRVGEIVPLYTISTWQPAFLQSELKARGASQSTIEQLTTCPVPAECGLIPYGFNRNLVVMEAILRGIDILVFIDTDVYPSVVQLDDGVPVLYETDFFGAHLEHLSNGASITTGEYSGYNILPLADFPGMDTLLEGLQKNDKLDFWSTSTEHRSLTTQPQDRTPVPCTKILGGNTAFKLSVFDELPPFFSSYYTCNGETFLARGEDTLLSDAIAKTGMTCLDIQLNPFHDTFDNFPDEPNLRNSKRDQTRFYYACTGWIGRNPLFNKLLGHNPKDIRKYQREKLTKGARALAEYTGFDKYLTLPEKFDISWDSLPRYTEEHKQLCNAWGDFVKIAH